MEAANRRSESNNGIEEESVNALQTKNLSKDCVITIWKPEEDTAVRGWSNMYDGILGLILGRLDDLVDHLRFGWVCRSWRSARLSHRSRRLTPPQLPLLLPARPLRRCIDARRHFLRPFDGRSYSFDLPELVASGCVGSFSTGWLIMLRCWQIYLYNPFTLEKVMLPRAPRRLPFRVVASPSEPTSNNPKFAVLCFGLGCRSFSYLRLGDEKWSHHCSDLNALGAVQQVVAVEEKFYALTMLGDLVRIDLDADPMLNWLDQVVFDHRNERVYLLESDGELLLLLVTFTGQSNSVETNAFRFFKLDTSTPMPKLVEAEAGAVLKDRVLFLGEKSSMSMEARGQSRIYTAALGECRMFDFGTGTGSVCHEFGRPFLHPREAIWVLPEQLYRARRPAWWMPWGSSSAFLCTCFCIFLLFASLVALIVLFVSVIVAAVVVGTIKLAWAMFSLL